MTRRPARRHRTRPSGPTRRRIRLRGIERNRIAAERFAALPDTQLNVVFFGRAEPPPAQARCAM